MDHKGYVHYIESARFLAGEFVGYAVAKLPFGPCVTALVCPVMFFYGGNKRRSATAELLHNGIRAAWAFFCGHALHASCFFFSLSLNLSQAGDLMAISGLRNPDESDEAVSGH